MNHIKMLRFYQFVILILSVIQTAHSQALNLTKEEETYIFVADKVFEKIIPEVNSCWKILLDDLSKNPRKTNAEYEKQTFWNQIFIKQLKPIHGKIREIDSVVLNHQPSRVLDNIVNVTDVKAALNLSQNVHKIPELEWIETVKDGWIKVSGMIETIHYKYNLIFDHLFKEGLSKHVAEDLNLTYDLNETLAQYLSWYKIEDTDDPKTAKCEPISYDDLSAHSKIVISGNKGPEKNLFQGLRQLLKLESKRVNRIPKPGNETENTTTPYCTSPNDTIAGKRGRLYRYVPVYVLLHLLTAEFKYYLLRNIAGLYHCVHFSQCNAEISKELEKHLTQYYSYYFYGMIDVFKEKVKEPPLPSTVPKEVWRWRCDPPIGNKSTPLKLREHVEGVTFTRFYDYQTHFLAEEKELSLTKTCRDSCDVIDGSYSTTPCEEDDWECLEEDKDFDCYELKRIGLPCPGKPRTICPYGIKCRTTRIKEATVCNGQRDRRFMEWFEGDTLLTGKDKLRGKKTKCAPQGIQNFTLRESIIERSGLTKFEPENCEICVCKCYEPINSNFTTHRYISLLGVPADIENQKAMVGIKFEKIGDVIYPKIAEAKVTHGQPVISTIAWKTPVLVTNTSDTTQVFRLGRNAKNILLDDYLAPKDHVITGVKFTVINTTIGGDYLLDPTTNSHVIFPVYIDDENQEWTFKPTEQELVLEVHMTALTDNGELNTTATIWKSNKMNGSLSRSEVFIEDPDESILNPEPSQPKSSTNQFIQIQSSSLKKDAGQTPVPFFDTQEVLESDNITLIRGLGLYYKSQEGYGGFLGFHMISMPMTDRPTDHEYDLWHAVRVKKN